MTKLNGMAENAINNATSSGGTTATNAELEAMKQEILREMRKEMAKMKQDIIEGTSGIRNFSQLVDFELTYKFAKENDVIAFFIFYFPLLPFIPCFG